MKRESDFGRMSSSVEIEECENGSPSLESGSSLLDIGEQLSPPPPASPVVVLI